MALISLEERQLVIANLLERKEHFGRLTSFEINTAASACGVTPSTIYRWLKDGQPRTRIYPKHQITDAESAAFFEARGDVAAAHRALVHKTPDYAVSVSTYRRAINREFDLAARKAAQVGLPGRDQTRIVLKQPARHRNERWEGDHTMIELHVLAPGHARPVRPWITWLIDVGTRAIMGWGISAGAPNRGAVLAAIRSGVERDGEKPFYGVPGELLWDNGLEFTSGAVTEAAALLGSAARTTAPYSPTQKPFIERLNRTLEVELISKMPHYVDGPRRKDGTIEDRDESMLTLTELAHQIDVWIEHYNNARPHKGIGGKTPAEKWASDPTPIREVSGEAARHFTLERLPRVVRRDGGVHVDSVAYIAEELYGYEGETIQAGRIPYDSTRIEIFHEGRWLCTATPTVLVSAEESRRLRAAASKRDERLKRERRLLAKQQRVRIGTITSDALDPRILPPGGGEAKKPRGTKDPFGLGNKIGEVR